MDYKNLGIAAALLFGAYKFSGGNKMVQGAVLSVAAVIAAKQIPYVKDYV
jgi:hypothetical protein